MPGSFVAFEGLDGSGKSSVLRAVVDLLRGDGHDVLTTREPGGTAVGAAIRDLVLGSEHDMSARTELLLMCADRAEHVASVIRPALEAGRIVLCDRYEASTRAYQGGGLGIADDEIRKVIDVATGGLMPDLYVLFDVEPVIATERRSADSGSINALDARSLQFKMRVRDRYLEMAAGEPNWISIDATMPLEQVIERSYRVVVDHVSRAVVP